MKRMLLCLVALTVLQARLTPPCRAAETNAVIPYKALNDMITSIAGVDQSKLEIRVFVASKSRAVRPSEINLTIQSTAQGPIPVVLGTNGQVLQFPQTKALRHENPGIRSNQPKGTLELRVAVQLPLPDKMTFRYQWLGDGVAEMNKAIKARAGMMSLFAPKVQGVIFFFPESSAEKAKVEIASAGGRKEYTADKHGQVKFRLEKALLGENPEVTFSEKPNIVVPDMADMD